ncbi:unnamed protein product [Brassicogethes aeneus]|uniref:Amine oxidase domain-containing protein n=1 Tax=Brassicogethes aeneus TaxID=1431903 RepID=A0A9P0B8H5_BRAAE|nr:unnamed protein product [Brassicogethes aeneus]
MFNTLKITLNTKHFKQLKLLRNAIRSLTLKKDCKDETKEEKKDVGPKDGKLIDCILSTCIHKPSIIIIGAGMAGLSAAERLAACDLTNFTILEATERPGGRIHSCWMDNVITELGCSQITGASTINSVYNLAAREGLKTQRNGSTSLVLTSDGKAIEDCLANMVYRAFLPIQLEAGKVFSMNCGKDYGSLKDFLTLRIDQEIQKFPENFRYDVHRTFYGLLNCLTSSVGEDLSKVSADNYGSKVFIPGGNCILPDGLVHVLTPLLKNLPEKCIKYRKPVGIIKWGADLIKTKGPRVLVQCCDGECYGADYVIVTVPLGVLKDKANTMFCPKLPQCKLEAINKLGFGHINRIFLKYNPPFWVRGGGNINLAWSHDELRDQSNWAKSVSCIEELPNSDKYLQVTIAGEDAELMEEATDEEVVKRITKLLRQFTGDPTVPYPTAILRSTWSSHRYFCGANSYIKLNSHIGHQTDLGSPIPDMHSEECPVLLFAGEATIPGHYGTLHGARLSGIREADRIMQLTKKMAGPPIAAKAIC